MAGKSITPKHSMGKEGGDLHEKLIKIDLRPTTTDKSQLASQTPRPSSVTSKLCKPTYPYTQKKNIAKNDHFVHK